MTAPADPQRDPAGHPAGDSVGDPAGHPAGDSVGDSVGDTSGSTPAGPAAGGRSIWLTRRAVIAHVALAVWVPGCAVAAWWQVGIALGGDGLGWVYSVMWPCFAVFGIVFWWFLLHDDPERLGARGLRHQVAVTTGLGGQGDGAVSADPDLQATSAEDARRLAEAEEDDPELAQYNAYLAALADKDKSWRRSG